MDKKQLEESEAHFAFCGLLSMVFLQVTALTKDTSVMKCSHEKKRSLFSPLLESVMICVSSNLESGNDDDSVGDNKNYSFLIQV